MWLKRARRVALRAQVDGFAQIGGCDIREPATMMRTERLWRPDRTSARRVRQRLSKKTGCGRWALKPGRASRDVIAEEAVAFGFVKIL